jgi:hypothetical protein
MYPGVIEVVPSRDAPSPFLIGRHEQGMPVPRFVCAFCIFEMLPAIEGRSSHSIRRLHSADVSLFSQA